VREWKGSFGTASNGLVMINETSKPHYVGYPGMHRICRNSLHHESIRVVLQTRVCGTHLKNNNKSGSFYWSIASHKNKKKALGEFDCLVVSESQCHQQPCQFAECTVARIQITGEEYCKRAKFNPHGGV